MLSVYFLCLWLQRPGELSNRIEDAKNRFSIKFYIDLVIQKKSQLFFSSKKNNFENKRIKLCDVLVISKEIPLYLHCKYKGISFEICNIPEKIDVADFPKLYLHSQMDFCNKPGIYIHLLDHIFRLETVVAPNSKKIPLTERVIGPEPLRMPNQPTFSQQASNSIFQNVFEV